MMSEQPGMAKNVEDFMMIAGNIDAPKVYSPTDVQIGEGFDQESPSDIFSMMQK